MSHSFCNHIYHIVFSTKTHFQWLNREIRPRLHAYIGGAIRDLGGKALIVGGIADHVHVLAKLRQDRAVSDIIRAIKANSSQWIHKTFPHHKHVNEEVLESKEVVLEEILGEVEKMMKGKQRSSVGLMEMPGQLEY